MKNNIHYTLAARRDLDGIWDYIVLELQNRSAAEHVVNRILDAVDKLEHFPQMGTPLSTIADNREDYSFLVSGSYMVFYRVNGQDVYVDRVLYARRDYLNVLFRDLPEDTATE